MNQSETIKKKPKIDLRLSPNEISQLRDGIKFDWELKTDNGEKVIISVSLDAYGDWILE